MALDGLELLDADVEPLPRPADSSDEFDAQVSEKSSETGKANRSRQRGFSERSSTIARGSSHASRLRGGTSTTSLDALRCGFYERSSNCS